MATSVASTLRQALALIVPVAVLLPLISQDAARLVWGHGAAADTYDTVGVAIALFAPGLVLFTSHYLLLRGFYALERTRTVFWVQCVIAATNITLALVLTGGTGPEDTAAGLVLAYGGAYLVGVVGSYLLLRHVLGGLDTPLLVRFLVRLVIAVGLAAVAGYAVRAGVDAVLAPGDVQAIVSLALVTLSGAVVYLLVSRMLRIAEVNAVVGLVTSRLGR